MSLHAAFDDHGAVFVNFGRLREACGAQVIKMVVSYYTSSLGKLGEVCDLDTLDARRRATNVNFWSETNEAR